MTQVLHILRKDIRHLWLELSVYLTLLLLFFLVEPTRWSFSSQPTLMVSTLLDILIPATWLVLLARSVHGESLVGENQFWITRPYRWPSLLAAKALFLTLCIALPFAVLQSCLLWRAGLSPFSDVAGMVQSLGMTALYVWVPFTLAAAITVNLTQTFFTMVGVVIAWIATLSAMASEAGARMALPYAQSIFWGFFTVSLLALITYQYRERNTRLSRILFGVLTVMLLMAYWGVYQLNAQSPFDRLISARYHPDPTVSMRLDTGQQELHRPSARHDFVWVTLPVRVLGLAPTEKLGNVNAMWSLSAPRIHKSSAWYPTSIDADGITLHLPVDVWNSVHSQPVNIHLSVAADRLAPVATTTASPEHRFTIPHGLCVNDTGSIVCRNAFRRQSPLLIESRPCPNDTRSTGRAVLASLDAATGIDPIRSQVLTTISPCHGNPIEVTQYNRTQSLLVEADLPPLVLESFADR